MSVSNRYSIKARPYAAGDAQLPFWFDGLSYEPHDVAARLRWKYDSNPAPKSKLLYLHSDTEEQPCGAIGLFARQWSMAGARYPSAVATDLVISQSHRSLGPALHLCIDACGKVQTGEYSMAYGMPNAISAVLKKRLEFQSVQTITRYSRVLRWRNVIRARLPAPLAIPVAAVLQQLNDAKDWILGAKSGRRWKGSVWQGRFDARFDQLWQRSHESFGLCGVRDQEFLNWRFNDSDSGYKNQVFVVERQQDAELGGYIVWWQNDDGDVLIKDFLFSPDCGIDGLFQLFVNSMKSAGHERLSIALNGPADMLQKLRRIGFVAREQTEALFCVDQASELASAVNAPLFLTAADNDA